MILKWKISPTYNYVLNATSGKFLVGTVVEMRSIYGSSIFRWSFSHSLRMTRCSGECSSEKGAKQALRNRWVKFLKEAGLTVIKNA